MPKYEVSVREWQHITVEADTEEEARVKAKEQSGYREPEVYQEPVQVDDDT